MMMTTIAKTVAATIARPGRIQLPMSGCPERQPQGPAFAVEVSQGEALYGRP